MSKPEATKPFSEAKNDFLPSLQKYVEAAMMLEMQTKIIADFIEEYGDEQLKRIVPKTREVLAQFSAAARGDL